MSTTSKLFLTTAAASRKITSEDINGGGATHNPSFRVYYGGSPVAVPFTWESAPGTPKHNLSSSGDDDNLKPPLTPPPSFYSAASMNSNSSAARNLLGTLFSGGGNYWSSSSSSSTSSSGRDSADVYMSRRKKKKKPRLMSRWFFCSGMQEIRGGVW